MGTTPVEWLEKELKAIRLDVDKNVLKFIDISFEMAKVMQEQQISEAYEDGYSDSDNNFELNKEYYNEKFKNQLQG